MKHVTLKKVPYFMMSIDENKYIYIWPKNRPKLWNFLTFAHTLNSCSMLLVATEAHWISICRTGFCCAKESPAWPWQTLTHHTHNRNTHAYTGTAETHTHTYTHSHTGTAETHTHTTETHRNTHTLLPYNHKYSPSFFLCEYVCKVNLFEICLCYLLCDVLKHSPLQF